MKETILANTANLFQRSRNVGRNMLFGFLNRIFSLLLPFIVRTILIYRFGVLYLGMNSLLSSIFQILNLAELGFGSAVVYSLYKPMAQGDNDTVCAYLGTYRKIYRFIGLLIIGIGVVVMPLFPYLIKDNPVPENMNLFVWYLFFLADAAVSYLMYGYKTAIPSALQRNDLLNKIDTMVLFCKSLVQVSCLLLTKNFYFYLLSTLLFTVLRNLLISYMVDRHFPQYDCRGKISQEQFRKLKYLVAGLALSKFRVASRHAIDNICITAFVSLTMTAIYSNYFLILGGVASLFGILDGAMVASVGNSIAVDSQEKNYCDMCRFNFMYMLMAGWAATCLLCLYQPFMRLWVGYELMLGLPEMAALCLYFYVLKMGDIRWIYHQAAGLWWKARYIVIAEMVFNIVLNILLAKYWGVQGIITASLISLFFIDFIGGAWVLFKEYFNNARIQEFFTDQALYFVSTVLISVLCFQACEASSKWLCSVDGLLAHGIDNSTGFLELILRLVLCSIISAVGYFVFYHKMARFKDAKCWISKRISLICPVK